jgi:hypothetical protein
MPLSMEPRFVCYGLVFFSIGLFAPLREYLFYLLSDPVILVDIDLPQCCGEYRQVINETEWQKIRDQIYRTDEISQSCYDHCLR